MNLRSILLFVAAVALGVTSAHAGSITITGDVNPAYNGTDDPWEPEFVNIGDAADGEVTVAGGSVIDPDFSFELGIQAGVTGTLNITGAGSMVNGGSNPKIGRAGTGNLNVTAGGQFDSSVLGLAEEAGAMGTIIVDGVGSSFSALAQLNVASAAGAMASIEITGGATATVGPVNLGQGGTAMMEVRGVGSAVSSTSGQQWVGASAGGVATLTVADGGTYEAVSSILVGSAASSNGTLNVNGPGSRVSTSGFTNIGGTNGQAAVNVTGGAELDLYWNQSGSADVKAGVTDTVLDISGAGSVVKAGTLNVSGDGVAGGTNGIINVGAGTSLSAGLLIVAIDGIVNINGGDVELSDTVGSGNLFINGGVVNLNAGRLDVQGDFSINSFVPGGQFNFSGGEIETNGNIDLGQIFAQQGGRLAPGSSPGMTTIVHGYTLDGGALEIELFGNTAPGLDFDQVVVIEGSAGPGEVDLIGADSTADSSLELIMGYAGMIGDSFIILDNDNTDSILGQFLQGTSITADFGMNRYGFDIDYAGGDGNDIALTLSSITAISNGPSVPEPTSAALLMLAGVMAMRRRASIQG